LIQEVAKQSDFEIGHLDGFSFVATFPTLKVDFEMTDSDVVPRAVPPLPSE
jgi:hypothetical protein